MAVSVIGAIFSLYIWAIVAAMSEMASESGQKMAEQKGQLQVRYGLFALIAVLLAVGLPYLVLQRMVTQPLKEAMKAAQQLASCDLTTQVHVGRRDEISQLMQAINGISQ